MMILTGTAINTDRNKSNTVRDIETLGHTVRENLRISMRIDLEVLSSIDPITITSTGDSE